MKELSVEEKARRYDGAIKRLEDIETGNCQKTFIFTEGLFDYIFPELKENEGERIRKALLRFHKSTIDIDGIKGEDILAWLEKQGEHKEVTYLTVIHIGKSYKCIAVPRYTSFQLGKIYKPEDVFVRDLMNLCAPCFKEIDEKENKVSEQKPTEWSIFDYRTWQYIVADVLTKKEGIGQYLDDGTCKNIAKYMQEEWSKKLSIAQKSAAWSEEDKKMLKWITGYLENKMLNAPILEERTACKNAIVWFKKLEDEQKPADKVEPKFKVGDWVVSPNGVYWHIDAINNNRYIVSSTDGACADWPLNTNLYHLWTIEDAKEGDVLCDYHEAYDNPLIFILKMFEHVNFGLVRPSDYSSYCFLTSSNRQRFKKGTYHHEHNIKPATKEQCDLLFSKMKEAGYMWDAEKKELKKIEQKPTAWSEEDKRKIDRIYSILRQASDTHAFSTTCRLIGDKECIELQDFLKSLRPQSQWKPSDEQIKALETTLYTNMSRNDERYSVLSEFVAELKKLREE